MTKTKTKDEVYTIGFEGETLPAHLVVMYLLKQQSVEEGTNPEVEISWRHWQSQHRKGQETMRRLLKDGFIQRNDYYIAPNISDDPQAYKYRFTEKGLANLKLLRLNPDNYHTLAWRSFKKKVHNTPINRTESALTNRLFGYVKECHLSFRDLMDLDVPTTSMVTPVQIINHSPIALRSDTELRYHTSFSLLPSAVKSKVTLSGQSLVELDISASNPFLLAFSLLATQRYTITPLTPPLSALQCTPPSPMPNGFSSAFQCTPPSPMPNGFSSAFQCTPPSPMPNGFGEFVEACLSGEIYNLLVDTLQPHYKKTLTRDDGKLKMMLLMNERTSRLEKFKEYGVIKEAYPTVVQMIEAMKETLAEDRSDPKQKKLGVELMRQESRMVIDTICADLLNYNVPFVTAHDAIWTPPQYASAVKSKMVDHYTDKFGIAPNITIER